MVYLSDFGEIAMIPDRVMATDATAARNAILVTPSMAAVGVLRPMATEYPAKTGDANKFVVKTEWCLIMKNQAAHGVCADLYGLTAST